MNDDTDKPLNTVGDDALEARITAWVLGEASSFEAGELEKLCAADPVLGLFERRLRVLHGLVAEDFKEGPAAEWKLAAERRTKITDLLGVEPEVEQKIAARRKTSRGPYVRGLILALAACLVFGIFSIWLIGGVGVSAKRQKSAVAVNFSAGGGGGGSEAPMAMAPSDDFGAVERGAGAPVKKPDTSYAHLGTRSPFTTKPAPPAMPAAQEARQTAASGLALDGVDRSNPGSGAGGPLPSAATPAAPAAKPGSGLASHTASDGDADLRRAEDSLALLKEKAANGGAAGAPEQQLAARSKAEGIAGPTPVPATPAPEAKPAALAANEPGEVGFGHVMGGGAADGGGARPAAETAPDVAATAQMVCLPTS